MPTIGDTAPDFDVETTEGKINFHDWIGDSWAVLFSHPRDFTPVCTTELGYMASIKPEFDKRGVKIIGLSVDPLENHEKWASDIAETQGTAPNFPMIADTDFNVSKLYGMLPADVEGDPTERTPAENGTLRYALENVTLLLWLLGTASGEPELIEPLHGSRLRMMLEKTTDTTVRGVVYEAAGPVGAELTASGLAEMELAKEKNAIPYGLITADPLGDRDVWLAQAHGAIEALLAGPRRTTPDG